MSEAYFARRTPRCVISIQARMASKRLPGKVMLEVLGRPLLAYQIERLKRQSAPVVIATTTDSADDPIAALGQTLGIMVVRGSLDDVPARHLAVARATDADVLGFVGADQVFVSPVHFTVAFAHWQTRGMAPADYVRVIGLPHGLHVWAVARWALAECRFDLNRTPDEIEHTGAYWDTRPERFRTVDVDMKRASDYRLTVDTPEDFEVHRRIIEALYPENPEFTVDDIIAWLDEHPDVAALNSNVSQYYWHGAPREGVRV
jgi:spore coat polysaccharide biosynthesis protein SpsF